MRFYITILTQLLRHLYQIKLLMNSVRQQIVEKIIKLKEKKQSQTVKLEIQKLQQLLDEK